MSADGTVQTMLARDRFVIGAALASITVVAWGYMIYEARAMDLTGVCECAGMVMSGPDLRPWTASALPPLFLMWAGMMVAMMIPSASPMILTFALVSRRRREGARPYIATMWFISGYIGVWTAFSVLAAVAQWALHGAALLSPGMVSTSPLLGGGLLVAAGVFQWSPLKDACLTHCRTPLSFLMTEWREGRYGAAAMGLKHGLYCTGCCWFLMALLFVAGVMNMLWVALIAGYVLLEKVAPRGLAIGRLAGALLVAWGGWMMVRG